MAADGIPEGNLETRNHPNSGKEGERVEVQGVSEREMGEVEREIFLLVELYADEENDSTEVKRKKRMARAALTSWKEKIETFEQRLLQCGSEMRSIMNEVYNLVSLYSVFEGVVLAAVATSSRLECQHLWSPVSLSLFAYFMLVVVAFKKFGEIRDLEETKASNRTVIRVLVGWVLTLRETGYADFDFDRDCEMGMTRRRYIRRRPPFWRNALGLTVPLTIFTAALEFSVVHILCWS